MLADMARQAFAGNVAEAVLGDLKRHVGRVDSDLTLSCLMRVSQILEGQEMTVDDLHMALGYCLCAEGLSPLGDIFDSVGHLVEWCEYEVANCQKLAQVSTDGLPN